MASTGYDIPKETSSDRYAAEAASVYLRTLGLKYEPKTNLSDLISGRNDRRGR